MLTEQLVLKCTEGLFKGRFLYLEVGAGGTPGSKEIFGSGLEHGVTMSIENADLDPVHCKVFAKDAEFYLADLGSSSGTWVKIPPELYRLYPLTVGSTLRIGGLEFLLKGTVDSGAPVFIGPSQDSLFPSSSIKCLYEAPHFYIQNLDTHSSIYLRAHESEEFRVFPGISFQIGSLQFEASRFNVGVHSETGKRSQNEDSETTLSNLFCSASAVSIYAVYDGHGGSECSAFLQSQLHTHIVSFCRDSFTDAELVQSFYSCDRAFCAENPDTARRMGSTAALAIIHKDELICCNVGDSRILLCARGQAISLTRDHKPSVPEEARRITQRGGLVLLGRVMGKLAVSRAFGDFEFKDLSLGDLPPEITGPLVVAEPEISRCSLDAAHEFLLVACDGLFEVFTGQEAVSFVRERLKNMPAEEQDPQRVVEELVREAVFKRGSKDNVSAVLVTLLSAITD